MSDEKCLVCFPLECGVTTVAVYTCLAAVCTGVQGYMEGDAWGIYGVFLAAYALMSAVWIYTLAAPSESSRKLALLSWIVLCCGVGRIWYLYLLASGKIFDHVEYICNQEQVDQINSAGVADAITVEDCEYGQVNMMWADLFIGWLFHIYLATAISRWASNGDGYEKA